MNVSLAPEVLNDVAIAGVAISIIVILVGTIVVFATAPTELVQKKALYKIAPFTVLLGVTGIIASAAIGVVGETRGENAVAQALEAEYGIAELAPLQEDGAGFCHRFSEPVAAEYTWLTEDGDRAVGILAKTPVKDGACSVTLTPQATY